MEPVEQIKIDGTYLDEFKIIKTLGSGYHAKVKLAIKDGKQYAIKRFKQDTADLSVLEHELKIMSQLKHNNIVQLYEVRKNAIYKKHDGLSYQCFAIILEYINGGELFQYVARCGRFQPNVARTYFTMLLDALKYIHAQGITHRDIKPENILLDKDFNLKVTDFGFSTYSSRGELNTRLGTEGYMAPEIRERKYQGKDVDLFAAGIILFILYSGSPPFEKATKTDPYYKVFSAKKFDVFWNAHSRSKPQGFYSQQFKDLINNMLIPIPSERLTMDKVINHPWTTGDSVTLTQINNQFTIRKQKIDEARQKQRKQKTEKKQKIKTLQNQDKGKRSTSQFSNFFQILQNIKLDASLLKQVQTEENDFILNQTPEYFIAFIQQFFENKKSNLITNQQQNQTITVTFDSTKFQIIIHVRYSVLQQFHNIEIKCQLTKTNDNKLRVRFSRDENGSSIRSLSLIEILKREFDYLL